MNEMAACGFPARGLAGSIVNREPPSRAGWRQWCAHGRPARTNIESVRRGRPLAACHPRRAARCLRPSRTFC